MGARTGLGALLLIVTLQIVASGTAAQPVDAADPFEVAEPEARVLTVEVDATNLTRGAAGYLEQVDRAMAYWEGGPTGLLDAPVRFQPAEDGQRADLRIIFQQAPTVPCPGAASAYGCARAPAGDQPGRVLVALTTPGDQLHAYPYVGYVVRHELGHVLGLGHVEAPGHVMNSKAHPADPWAPGPDPLHPYWAFTPDPMLLVLAGVLGLRTGVGGLARAVRRVDPGATRIRAREADRRLSSSMVALSGLLNLAPRR